MHAQDLPPGSRGDEWAHYRHVVLESPSILSQRAAQENGWSDGELHVRHACLTGLCKIDRFCVVRSGSLVITLWFKLQKQLEAVLLGVIAQRRETVKQGSKSYGDDLLGLMLTESESENQRQNECKTFYLAVHESTASLLSWTMMLLAVYPDWQERARAEVGMILNETLRLYPPVIAFFRACFQDTWVQDLFVPKGAAVTFPALAIRHGKELWGPDANDFDPERFKDGIFNACKHPRTLSFLPRPSSVRRPVVRIDGSQSRISEGVPWNTAHTQQAMKQGPRC
ncbi:hypothetical protein SELMODRAFT_421234 [Selaginella moellendorffii]|uniref:Cytochrome P450 n=1 Tax=Selaginella moellendorffii TaxID=88036 RepID=D8SEF4_SELML|nr:hypothetical protein SELMODRAFT_421234 [Selaginella moellendorffii]